MFRYYRVSPKTVRVNHLMEKISVKMVLMKNVMNSVRVTKRKQMSLLRIS